MWHEHKMRGGIENTGMGGGGHAHFERGDAASILVVWFPVTAVVAHGES